MRVYHGRGIRKMGGTGGKRRLSHDKLRCHVGGEFTATKAGEKDVRQLKGTRGGGFKTRLKHAAYANVVKEGKVVNAKIRTVLETPDNKHYARQNIITKGAIIDTDLGKVKVTNRVGQDGVVNGILLK
ncbi:MAG: 30S ribosomal protein S8e [Candidatus Burarchaeum sp.]|nr:30S ribosomal protein S8e [Candidatus Burarchaeum sp.]MDO8340035.1 30S ribosomal protein S8e [Candidatus Burarchaeum sp.]